LLGGLHGASEQYASAIAFYERILHEFPEIDLAGVVSKKSNRHAILNRIAECHAALGNRDRAVDAYLQTIPHAESDRYRESAALRLLEYEPRLPSGSFPISKDVSAMLQRIADQSAFVVDLNVTEDAMPADEPIEVTYRLRTRLDCPIEWYCLVYRVWQLPSVNNPLADRKTRPPAPTVSQVGPIAPRGDALLTLSQVYGWLGQEVRPWIASPARFHRNLWHWPFWTPRFPRDARSAPEREPPHSQRVDEAPGDHGPVLHPASPTHKGTIVFRELPPGRYLVCVPAVDFQKVPKHFSHPAVRPTVFAWSSAVEFEVSDAGRDGPNRKRK
jgi:hypothetical protein